MYLILIFVSLLLLAGFFMLTNYEARRGIRLYEPQRARLDRTVDRIVFITEHVNLAEFLRDEVRHIAGQIGHDIVHFSLIVVRVVERLLTHLVRRLRNHPEIDTAPRETAREFVKTLSDFKGNLKATHPEITDVS
ncbi:MAG: hypothetical protein Q7R58_01865 [bacterium]|nr:hypothetical protein [bacterium]